MIYGLYLSAQGAETQSLRQDVIANNLANANTTSFKRNLAIFQEHLPFDAQHGQVELPEGLLEHTGGLSVGEVVTDFSPGSVENTDAPSDVALMGPGFFRVTDGEQEYLTRDGRLDLDRQGNLIQRETGFRVIGTNGPMTASPTVGPLEIGGDGTITQAGGNVYVGRLAVVEPTDYRSLVKVGDSLFETQGTVVPAAESTQVRQGHLENSGTNPVAEMMEMITASRAFEANVNMIKFQDESLSKLIGSLPRR